MGFGGVSRLADLWDDNPRVRRMHVVTADDLEPACGEVVDALPAGCAVGRLARSVGRHGLWQSDLSERCLPQRHRYGCPAGSIGAPFATVAEGRVNPRHHEEKHR